MTTVAQTIQQMQAIRGIPQYIFFSPIHGDSTLAVRRDIHTYKLANPSITAIDFILNSPGGIPDDAYRIITYLRNSFETVNVIIPHWAKSAATLLSLGANTIIMNDFSELGPLDIQLAKEREDGPGFDWESTLNDEYSLKNIEERSKIFFKEVFLTCYSGTIKINKTELSKQLLQFVADFYTPLITQVDPYKLGKNKRMLGISEHYANRILSQYLPTLSPEVRLTLVDYLVNQFPDHGYVIDFQFMSNFLPNVCAAGSLGSNYGGLFQELSFACMVPPISSGSVVIGFIDKISPPPVSQQVAEAIDIEAAATNLAQ